jgi:hypothetical protein
MSNFYPPAKFEFLLEIYMDQPADLRDAIEEKAGMPFPESEINDLMGNITYEGMEQVDAKIRAMMAAAPDEMSEIPSLDRIMKEVDDFRPFRVAIMPEYIRPEEGGLFAVPHFATRLEGQERYGSAGQAAVAGAVEMSVFDHVIRAENVYPGQEALDNRMAGKPLPDPCGVRADYRITIYGGEIQHPPRHPLDLPDRSAELTEDEGMSL